MYVCIFLVYHFFLGGGTIFRLPLLSCDDDARNSGNYDYLSVRLRLAVVYCFVLIFSLVLSLSNKRFTCARVYIYIYIYIYIYRSASIDSFLLVVQLADFRYAILTTPDSCVFFLYCQKSVITTRFTRTYVGCGSGIGIKVVGYEMINDNRSLSGGVFVDVSTKWWLHEICV